jgi:hypothetical protein
MKINTTVQGRVNADTYHVPTLSELTRHPIFATASSRPLTKDEVEIYLKTKERISNFSSKKTINPFDF